MSECAWCGSRLEIDWVDVSTVAWQGHYVPGRITCTNRECVPRCPTCFGVVGDIHGPECGPIILEKLGDLTPCTITRADCGPQQRNPVAYPPTRPAQTRTT